MNIDKFLKSIPPIANKIKQFFESMEPPLTIVAALGILLVFLGAIGYGLPLALIGGLLVGGSIGWHLASTSTISPSEMKTFLKKILVKGKEFFPTGYDPLYGKHVVGGIMILGSIVFLLTGVLTGEYSLVIIAILGMVGGLAMMGKLPGLKTYVESLDISTKLKDAKTKVGSLKFPSFFAASGDRTPFGLVFPLGMIAITGSVIIILFSIMENPGNTASNAMYQIEQCVEGKDSDLLEDKYILKAICGTKYQKELPNGSLTGGADFSLAGDNVVFSGHVNTTSVHIVTEFTILVEYDGETGTKTFHSVWIEPNNKHKFRFNPGEIDNKPSKEDVNTNDFVWRIRNVKGVPIIE